MSSKSPLSSLKRHKNPGSKTEKPGKPVNPFTQKKNGSLKFSVLNRRVHGQHRDASRSIANTLSSREKLTAEFKNRNKASKFVDRRFGANDGSLSTDEVMLERFKRERVKQSKKSNKYNLSEKSDIVVTHRGKKIDKDYVQTIEDDLEVRRAWRAEE